MSDPIPDPPIGPEGQTYVNTPGDMGTFVKIEHGHDALGNPTLVRIQTGKATYTGGKNTDGSDTEARDE